MKNLLNEATADLVSTFSVYLRPAPPPPGTKLPEIEMRFQKTTPASLKLDPERPHLFRLGGSELEIWGRIRLPRRSTRQFGKRLHRRGWRAL